MQAIIEARNQLDPLLEVLVNQLHNEGQATQRAFYTRIRGSIQRAQDEIDLATPLMELSTTAFVGFEFSPDAAVLIERILKKAEYIAEAFETGSRPSH